MKTITSKTFTIISTLFIYACDAGIEPEQDIPSPPPLAIDGDNFTKTKRDKNYDFDLAAEIDSYNKASVSSGRIALKRGRQHMVPNEKHNQFVLYEGESFVLDLAYYPINFMVHKDFTIQVLANFKPVEFSLLRTESDNNYPSLEELNKLNLELSSKYEFTLNNNATNKFTIIVPPSSFSKLKAYDIRILVVPNIRPREDIRRIVDPDLSFSTTLYYGGTEFEKFQLKEPNKTTTIKTQKQLTLLNGFGFATSTLLPTLDYLEDQSKSLASIFSTEESTTVSAIYYADPHTINKEVNNKVDIYTSFVVNKEIKEGKFVRVNRMPFSLTKSGVQAPVEEFTLNLAEDNEKTVYFLTFERPYIDQSTANEFDPLIRVSNPLFLKHDPQD